jgi:ubiquitin carboxyl-terminal hydrolase L5
VYELDGLKPGPIVLGDAGEDWWNVARPAIEARMARYEDKRSCLLSVCRSKSSRLQEQISEVTAAGGDSVHLQDLQRDLSEEMAWKAKQAEENVRRRHNFTPFVVALLKGLAKKGALQPMIDAAVTKRTDAAAAAK